MTRSADRTRPSRRAILGATSGLLALSAGCIADEAPALEGDDDGTNDEGGSGSDGDTEDEEKTDSEDDDDEDDETDVAKDVDYETQSVTHTDVPTDPEVDLLLDSVDAEDWLTVRGLGDEDTLDEFASETSFEESVLVALEAEARNLCYEMVLDELDVDDSSIELSAAVIDESTPETSCGQQVTGVGKLVRVFPTDGSISELSATITDQDGVEHGYGMGIAEETDEGAESDSGGESGSEVDDEANDDPADDGEHEDGTE